MNASIKTLIKLLLIGLFGIYSYIGGVHDISLQPDKGEEPPSAALTEIITPLQQMGNRLYCGDLVIRLPDGVTVEMQEQGPEEQQVGLVIDLEGVGDKPLAARLWITYYRAECSNLWTLLSALMDLLPDTTMRLRCYDTDKNIELFTYTSGYKRGYILIYEENICIVEEMLYGGRYVFGGLLDDQAVRWNDIYECGDRNNNSYIVLFDKLKIGKESFLAFRYTAQDNTRWLGLVQDGDYLETYREKEGDYGVVYQKIEIAPTASASEEQITYQDYNFDGFPDISVSSNKIYLWNPGEKRYVEAQVPEEFLWIQSDAVFSDTGVIWGHRYSYGEAGRQGVPNEKETLWKWEGNELVKLRECEMLIHRDMVQLWAYDTIAQEKIFSAYFTLEEYQQGNAKIQELYRTFYDQMVPEGTFFRYHTIDCSQEEMTYIPQGLLDKVTEAMHSGSELETLKSMVNDRELSTEEILSIAKQNIDLRQTVLDKDWAGAYLMVTADGDNDGVMDIIAMESYGGSDGSVDFVFYQGQKDGTFHRTDTFSSVREEFAMLEYDGKNYLFRTLFDYGKKIYNGIGITCYVDGERVEQAELMLVPEHYETTLVECSREEYRAYAEQVAAESLAYKAVFEEEENMLGSSEKKLSDYGGYQCDLNNDGIVDEYEKALWSTSSINVCEYLHFDGTGKAVETVSDALFSLEGTPVMMWVDAVQGKNVINVMSQTGLEDFAITGFLVSGFSYEQLYDICVDVTYGVNVSGKSP